MAQFESSLNKFDLVEHPLTNGYPLMGTWPPTLLLTIGYLLGVKFFTSYMRKRPKEFNVRYPMIVYNFTMVIWSAYMFLGFVYYGIGTGFTVHCWPVSDKRTPYSEGLAFIFYNYYLSKFVEFLDTYFFIARKRFNLVTVLHVYHHAVMSGTTWLAVRYGPGGFMTVPFVLNSLVHVFMYFYYGMAAMGPRYRHWLFWKKYMTVMQIVQFVCIIVHCIYNFRIDCRYPKVLVGLVIGNSFIFLILFSNFYAQSYKPIIIPVEDASVTPKKE